MVQAMSLFNQLLRYFPKLEFAALVKKHNAERASKGFSCRTQLVAMLFCQFAHAHSLREICTGLASCVGKLVHPGIDAAPGKSTLSYANKHRPVKLFEDLFHTTLARFRARCGDVKLADSFPINPGSIVAVDRGYNDYGLYGRWTGRGIFFVTRLKDNARYEVLR